MPKKSEDQKRVPLNCLVTPVTLRAIANQSKLDGDSQGVVIDRAIALLAFGEEIKRPRFGSARGQIKMSDDFDEPLEDVQRPGDAQTGGESVSRSEKRPMRQKGDKGR